MRGIFCSIVGCTRSETHIGLNRMGDLLGSRIAYDWTALVVGLALVMMETLNDFGTVKYFAVLTLTLGLFNVWIGTGGIEGAAQLASILLIFVMI